MSDEPPEPPEPVAEEAAEQAQAVLDLLREQGWTQGKNIDSQGRVCLGYAIIKVAMRYSWGAMHSLRDALKRQTSFPVAQLVAWNDMPGRTEEQVHDLLKSVGAK